MNVLLMVLDALREDMARPVNEVLLKYGFIRLKNVIAPAPWTLPSHASIFTGQDPILHGAHETRSLKGIDIRLKSDFQITQRFKKMGFTTYLFSANDYIRPFFGFKYFDYIEMLPATPIIDVGDADRKKLYKLRRDTKIETVLNIIKHHEMDLFFKYSVREISKKISPLSKVMYGAILHWPQDKGVTRLIKIFREIKLNEPFFIFINLMEIHEPYTLFDKGNWRLLINEKIPPSIIRAWKSKYPKNVRYLSKKIDALLDVLKNKEILENTLVIITSDHGQLLGEHGKISHGIFLYDELLQVPLWIHLPKRLSWKIGNISNRYLSLIKIKKILFDCLYNKICDFSNYYKSAVFSESYGIPFEYNGEKYDEKYLNKLERYRIAIYCCSGKGIFDVGKWKFNNISIPKGNVEYAKKQVIKHLSIK